MSQTSCLWHFTTTAYSVWIIQTANKYSRAAEKNTWLDTHIHTNKLLNSQDTYQTSFQKFSRGIHAATDMEVARSPSGFQPLSRGSYSAGQLLSYSQHHHLGLRHMPGAQLCSLRLSRWKSTNGFHLGLPQGWGIGNGRITSPQALLEEHSLLPVLPHKNIPIVPT